MAWVKIHDDILADPKLLRAARQGHAELQLLPWFLVFAKKAEDGGRLSVGGAPADAEDIAVQLPGVASSAVATGLASLLAIGVLSRDPDGCLRFAKWDDRQSKPSDSNEAWAERKRRQRKRERQERAAKSEAQRPAESAIAASSSEAVTPCHAGHVTPCHAIEQRRGEEKRTELSASGDAEVPVRVATWITPFADAWQSRHGGEMPIEPSLRPLRRLVKAHGEAEALRRWAVYLDDSDGRYQPTAAKFASTWATWEKARSAKSGSSAAPGAQDLAAALWARYQEHGLLCRRSLEEYNRIGATLVERGCYPRFEDFRAELRLTQPWTLNEARSDSWAIAQIAQRLSVPRMTA